MRTIGCGARRGAPGAAREREGHRRVGAGRAGGGGGGGAAGRWRDAEAVGTPLHWRGAGGSWERWTLRGWLPVEPAHPAAHLGWYEAEAIARWAGARLPTEGEWELAAGWEAGRKRRWPWGDG